MVVLGLIVTRTPGPPSPSGVFSYLGHGVIALVYLFFFYLANLYIPLSAPCPKNKVGARLIAAVAGATPACFMLSVVIPVTDLGFLRLVLLSIYLIPAAYIWRWGFERAFARFKKPVRVVIVGAGWAGNTIASVLGSLGDFEVVGFVDDDLTKRRAGRGVAPILGTTSDLQAIAERYRAGLLVLAITGEKPERLFRSLLDCKMNGIELSDMPTLYEELTGKLPVNHVRDSWFVQNSLRGVRKTVYAARLKRVLDIGLALSGLVLSLPVSLLTALTIVAESGLPVLYRQKRVGQNEREFWLLKFRSMRHGAEDGTGAVWARPGDDRVTRVGRVIRLLRLDEIPQMWNVLKGEMSFIGPRPERPEFVKELKKKIPYYSFRHTIKPGITGWAQVNYSYGASEEDALEKLQYDLFYLKNMSALLDLHILLRTIRVVLFRQGSR